MLARVRRLVWYRGQQDYRTRVSPYGTRFLPLHEIRDERYAVYFPIP
jgi:hypothetical protein